MAEQDTNNDGYLDYFEYIMAKQKTRDEEQKKEKEAQNK